MRRGFQSHPMVIRCRSSDSGSPEPSPSPNACPDSESNALRHAMNALALPAPPAPPALQPDAVRLLGECARLQKLGGGRFSELVNADIGREQTCSARSFCMFFLSLVGCAPNVCGNARRLWHEDDVSLDWSTATHALQTLHRKIVPSPARDDAVLERSLPESSRQGICTPFQPGTLQYGGSGIRTFEATGHCT
jgi:hypothetical protein